MEVVTGATSSLLLKLGALLQYEFKLQDKVKKEIESLQNELVFMNATLRMVAQVPPDQLDEHVWIWSVFLKDISYDMEDVMNTFAARVQVAPHLVGLIRKAFNMLRMGRTHHQIADMVEEVRSLIKEVADMRNRYRLDNIVTRPATLTLVVPPQRDNMFVSYFADECVEITRRHSGIKYEEPVGIEEHMKVLHNWITSGDGSDDHSTLFILGEAGVGKTTIAMALFRNYGDQFQRWAMVNMSGDPRDPRPILVNILSQLKPHELQGHDGDIDKMIAELQECLQGKRFLILLDDVWSASIFNQIRRLFPRTASGGRVIVTTQSSSVASIAATAPVHKVGLLSDEKARQLFMEVVGKENQQKTPPRLLEICNGLPLAIVTMAKQVACNPEKTEKEWLMFCSSFQPSPSKSHAMYQLKKILTTCYNDMPAEIKTCALYFSMFPCGQKISKKRLTRRWIAGGFVTEQQELSAEEVAEAYLNHLIRRNFIRAIEHSSNGKVKSYQVHDLFLEYIVSKASEENFVTTTGVCGMVPPSPSTKVRRLSAQYSGSPKYGEELETMNLSHVRDVTMSGSLKQLPPNVSFKFSVVVQLLDLEGCKDFKQHHTKEICRMFLLKYLSLRRTDIKKLTKRIGDLQFLETLDIRETDVIELPSAIFKLERLVNIFGGNKRTRKALKLPKEPWSRKKMKAPLRILTGVEISEETNKILNQLTSLRKLVIYKLTIREGSRNSIDLRCSIEYLGSCGLRALVIHDESAGFLKSLGDMCPPPRYFNALELSGKLVEIPKWIADMHALTKLTLSTTTLQADNLELLSKICSLFSLTFSLNAAKQDEETAAIIEDNKACSDGVILFPVGGFEKLKLLRFFAPYVPQLSFPDGAVPTLEKLELRFSNFEGLLGIRGLKNLQQVHIKVHDEASESTESIVKEMSTAAREDREGPRIIFD